MGLRLLTAGESHGRAIVGILEGVPAGVPVFEEDFKKILSRRYLGYGRGPRKNIEDDKVEILSGIWKDKTLGSPIAVIIWNQDQKFFIQNQIREEVIEKPNLVPLPGHADLIGVLKYNLENVSIVRERASARETVVKVALSVPIRRLLAEIGIKSVAFVRRIGKVEAKVDQNLSIDELTNLIKENEHFFITPDREVVNEWKKLVDSARENQDSYGGVVEIWVDGVMPGLGSYVDIDRRLDSRIARCLAGIQAVRAIELGNGLYQSLISGKEAIDEISYTEEKGIFRPTNHAGGIEGGMSNGERIFVRVYMKPIPGAVRKNSVNLVTLNREKPPFYRSDTVALDSLAVVAESMILLELASVVLEKFGGDCLDDLKYSVYYYLDRIKHLYKSKNIYSNDSS